MSTPSTLDVLLFAQGRAGVAALQSLLAGGHRVTGCFTHASRKSWEPSVADACARLGVPCATDPARADISLASRPHVVLSVYYGRKIEMPYLGLGTIGAFNVAASALPRYPGHFPVRWAILNNEPTWGVTVHQMTQTYCDGAILHKKTLVTRPQESAYDWSTRVEDAAAAAAVEAVAKLAKGDDHLVSVDSANTPFFPAGLPFGGKIDWDQPATRIESFVRALDFGRDDENGGYRHLTPPARANIGTTTLNLFRARAGGTASSYPPGTITRCDDEVWVQTGRGHLAIDAVAVDGVGYDAAPYLVARGFTTGDEFDTSHVWTTQQPSTREFSNAA